MEKWVEVYTPLIFRLWHITSLNYTPLAQGCWHHLLSRQASQVNEEILTCAKLNTLVITQSMADQTLGCANILLTDDVIQEAYDEVKKRSELGSQIVNSFPVSLINAALWNMVDEAFQHAQVIHYLTCATTDGVLKDTGNEILKVLTHYIAYLKELNMLVSWGMRVTSWKTFRSTLSDLNYQDSAQLDDLIVKDLGHDDEQKKMEFVNDLTNPR